MHAIILVIVLFLTSGEVKSEVIVGPPDTTIEDCQSSLPQIAEQLNGTEGIKQALLSCQEAKAPLGRNDS